MQPGAHLQPVPAATVLGHEHGLHSQCSPHEHVKWSVPPEAASPLVHLYVSCTNNQLNLSVLIFSYGTKINRILQHCYYYYIISIMVEIHNSRVDISNVLKYIVTLQEKT